MNKRFTQKIVLAGKITRSRFRFNTSLPLKITEAQVKQIKFISLPKLIDLIFKYDWPAYTEKFVTEKRGDKYTMYKAHFEGAPPLIVQ